MRDAQPNQIVYFSGKKRVSYFMSRSEQGKKSTRAHQQLFTHLLLFWIRIELLFYNIRVCKNTEKLYIICMSVLDLRTWFPSIVFFSCILLNKTFFVSARIWDFVRAAGWTLTSRHPFCCVYIYGNLIGQKRHVKDTKLCKTVSKKKKNMQKCWCYR